VKAASSAVGLLFLGLFLQAWVARSSLPWGYVMGGAWPRISRVTLPAAVALLGAAAFPHHAYCLSTGLHQVGAACVCRVLAAICSPSLHSNSLIVWRGSDERLPHPELRPAFWVPCTMSIVPCAFLVPCVVCLVPCFHRH